MWLDNLLEIKKEKNLSAKQIAERSNLPEKTVTRVLSGRTTNPYIDTLDRIATALECTIGDILAGTKTVVGDSNLSTLQENLNAVTAEKETITAERDLLSADNVILKDKITALTSEVELLNIQIKYQDKIIATHECYLKILNKNDCFLDQKSQQKP